MARVATGVKHKVGALWEAAAAGTPDIGVLLLISAGLEDEGNLADRDTVADILAATSDEATFTGYVRKTVAPAITRDDAADTQTLTLAGAPPLVVEWTAAGGAGGAGTNNVLGRMVYYYDPTPGSSTDAQKIHLASTPVNAATDGSTLRITIPPSGIATYRDGGSTQAVTAGSTGTGLTAGSVFDVHVNSAAAINADKLADGTARKLLTDGSVTNAKVSASAAITLDKTTDSATRLALSASERKKLAGVDEGDLIQRVGVPLYVYPDWFGSPPRVYDQIMDNAPTVKYLIVNPNTGPDASLNTDYQQQIKLAQASGVRVLGYVSTSYGSVALATILSDVTKWRTWYAVDGIFLDETNYDGTNETHYRSVYQGIKAQQPNLIVVANPGLGVVASMSDTADIFMSFEGIPADYRARATTNAPAWERLAPASKQWHLIHSVASLAEAREMLDISRTYRAGTVFVTDRTMPNPWLGLPTNTAIWQAQLNQCSGGEQAVDATAAALAAGTHTGISFAYNDPAGSISATASGGGGLADGSVTNVKVATAAAIDLDKTADSATRLAMTTAERTKLAGVATGATVYDDERAVDAAAAALALGTHTGISFAYNDPAGSISATASSGVPSDGSVTNIKVAAGAAISADKLADGTSNKILTSAERTTIATAAAIQSRVDALEAGATVIAANTQTASYTLALADAGKVVEMNAAGATIVTVPANGTVGFPVGTVAEVLRYGAGVVTLAGATSTVYAADTFDRADSTTTLGTSSGGQVWTAGVGTWGIIGNQAYLVSGTGQCVATVNAGQSDCTVSASMPVDSNYSLVFRYTDTNNYFIVDVSNGVVWRNQTGSFTAITGMASTFGPGTWAVTLSGTVITVFKDGVQVNSATDTFNQTATRHGMNSFQNTVGRWDNFSVASSASSVSLVRPSGSPLTLRAQGSSVALRKRATNEWVVSGDLG